MCLLVKLVYEGPLINLATTRAESSNMGLSTEQDTTNLKSGVFSINNKEIKGFFRAGEPAVNASHWDAIEAAPLNRRGWVLQERLLTPPRGPLRVGPDLLGLLTLCGFRDDPLGPRNLGPPKTVQCL